MHSHNSLETVFTHLYTGVQGKQHSLFTMKLWCTSNVEIASHKKSVCIGILKNSVLEFVDHPWNIQIENELMYICMLRYCLSHFISRFKRFILWIISIAADILSVFLFLINILHGQLVNALCAKLAYRFVFAICVRKGCHVTNLDPSI